MQFFHRIHLFFSNLLLFALLTGAVPGHCFSQNFVQDTLIVQFKKPEFNENPQKNLCIIDVRGLPGSVIGYSSKKKFAFIPIDLAIATSIPLQESISLALPAAIFSAGHRFEIKEFHLQRYRNTLLYPRDVMHAMIKVYSNETDTLLGSLLYENQSYIPFFHSSLKTGSEKALTYWLQNFATDIQTLASDKTISEQKLANFRAPGYIGKPLNLHLGSQFAFWRDTRVQDLEIFFSRREATPRFFRSGGYNIRRRVEKDFDAIEFGLSNDYFYYRFSPHFLFRNKSSLFIGINRWKDLDETNHKFTDILIGDLSASQSILFTRRDKRSLVFGFGVQQNLIYIHSKGFEPQLVWTVHLGVKL